MGDFDFLGDTSSSAPRRVHYRPQRKSSGCLPVFQVAFGIILAFVLMFGGCVFLAGVGMNELQKEQKRTGKPVGDIMTAASTKVAKDAIEQYRTICETNGSEIDRHVRAGFVAEAFLQAGDKENYAKWKRIADAHGQRAGLPIQP